MSLRIMPISLNIILRVAQLYPLIHRRKVRARMELRTVKALGRSVKVRIFHPARECAGVVLDFHGGGWTIGNARMADDQNSQLALKLGVAVISVDYRLAVSISIEEVIGDCEAAAIWAVGHIDHEFRTEKLLFKGSSAGAHLAVSALIRLRNRLETSRRIIGIVLHFGLYDFSGTSMVRNAGSDTLILHGPTVRATLKKLTPGMTDEERKDPSISPLYADLAGLPPALFVVGAEDILLEDNRFMAAHWQAANKNAELLVVPACPHAFTVMSTSIARKVEAFVYDWISDQLR